MRKGLKDLGYSEKWVKFGLIDDSILSAQMSFFQKEGAQNPEHYRYSSFLNWLHKKKTLTDVEIENYS